MTWQPIETAPKTGTEVDLWDEMFQQRLTDCFFDPKRGWRRYGLDDWGIHGETSVKGHITHWMPKPPPPKVA